MSCNCKHLYLFFHSEVNKVLGNNSTNGPRLAVSTQALTENGYFVMRRLTEILIQSRFLCVSKAPCSFYKDTVQMLKKLELELERRDLCFALDVDEEITMNGQDQLLTTQETLVVREEQQQQESFDPHLNLLGDSPTLELDCTETLD